MKKPIFIKNLNRDGSYPILYRSSIFYYYSTLYTAQHGISKVNLYALLAIYSNALLPLSNEGTTVRKGKTSLPMEFTIEEGARISNIDPGIPRRVGAVLHCAVWEGVLPLAFHPSVLD